MPAGTPMPMFLCGYMRPGVAGGGFADFSAHGPGGPGSRKALSGGYCHGVGGVGNALGWPVT